MSLAVAKIRQAATRLMQEASGVLGSRGHAELAHVHGVHAARGKRCRARGPGEAGSGGRSAVNPLRDKQAAQQRVRIARINFGHQVNQQPRLRRIVRRILVDAEKAHHAVNQVVESGAEVGRAVVFIIASPAVEAEAVVLVFLQRRGIEDAENILAVVFADFDGFDVVVGFSGGAPVEGVDILQRR